MLSPVIKFSTEFSSTVLFYFIVELCYENIIDVSDVECFFLICLGNIRLSISDMFSEYYMSHIKNIIINKQVIKPVIYATYADDIFIPTQFHDKANTLKQNQEENSKLALVLPGKPPFSYNLFFAPFSFPILEFTFRIQMLVPE